MNLISQDYLMHHGVKGMKWGVRKRQETYRKAAKQAKQFGQYAVESHKNYKEIRDVASGKVKGTRTTATKEDASRWMRVSSRQKKAYDELYKKYSSTPVNKITRKDYKAAKKFLKTKFEDADFTDVMTGNKTTNYQLRKDYDYETGAFKKKKYF